MNAATPLSVEQAAERLGIDDSTLYRWIKDDRSPVPAIRMGKRIVFAAGQVDFFVTWGRLPESPAELAEHMRELHGTPAVSA